MLALYILVLLGVAWFSLHPIRIPIFISPSFLGSPQEPVQFPSENGPLLKGWWVAADQPRCIAVISHGYMMNRAEMAPVAHKLRSIGVSSLLVDLRAHGWSGGKKSGLGYNERHDVLGAIAFARSRHPGLPIILIGSSMGAAASAFALGDRPDAAQGLVLDCAYSRLPSAVLGWWRFLGGKVLAFIFAPTTSIAGPLAGFNPYRVDVARHLSRVTAPVLLIHGDKDTLALPAEAERNYAACAGEAELVWMRGCGHAEGRWIRSEEYFEALLRFVEKVIAAAPPLGVL